MAAKMLDRDSILSAPDIRPQRIEVPEWGGFVYGRGLTARERDAFEAATMKQRNGQQVVDTRNMRARLAALGICDEAGRRVFSDEDISALGAKSSLALERVFDAVRNLSGMTNEDLAELEGNSSTPMVDGDSLSDSPSPSGA